MQCQCVFSGGLWIQQKKGEKSNIQTNMSKGEQADWSHLNVRWQVSTNKSRLYDSVLCCWCIKFIALTHSRIQVVKYTISDMHDDSVVMQPTVCTISGVWVCDKHMFVSQRGTKHLCFVPLKYERNWREMPAGCNPAVILRLKRRRRSPGKLYLHKVLSMLLIT